MQTKSKTAIAISIFMILSMAASITLSPNVLAQVTPSPGTHIPTYAHMNVFPNPVGVGQQITLGIFLATPLETSSNAHNFTVNVVPPTGSNETLGPYTADTTGGTVAYYTPDQLGNYTFQFFYPGEALGTASSGYASLINDPSNSVPVTITVQQDPVIPGAVVPFTPLPTQWWQTPVSAENSQNWYAITGPWLGYSAVTFAATGGYNSSSFCNPYTEDVLAGHVLWTTPWLVGGVAGGLAGPGEDTGHFWSTFQYTPRYAPVIMNGIIYSTWYTFSMSTGAHQGIRAIDLYTGKDLWVINTTNTLLCGMQFYAYTVNDYGVRGPWIWTTGTLPASDTGGTVPPNTDVALISYFGMTFYGAPTQYNLYDGMTGKYVMSIVNGSSMTFGQDNNGNMIGYFINNTAGTQIVHPRSGQNVIANNSDGPHLTAVNMTVAMGAASTFSPSVNSFRAMNTGYMFDVPVPTDIKGAAISPALFINSMTGDKLCLTGGFVHGQNFGSEVPGWLVVAGMDAYTGEVTCCVNMTYPDYGSNLPFTRTGQAYADGLFVNVGLISYVVDAVKLSDGSHAWTTKLTGLNGADPNIYDQFGIKTNIGPGVIVWSGLGGDIWCQNTTDGSIKWYTNTTQLIGSSGIETPYNVWPLWVFGSSCASTNVQYLAIGHEYNPPLFRGAQLLAVNMTDGSLIWSELDTSVDSTAIAYGKLVSINAYDNQLYCFGKGPSATTVSAPSVGVTTSTPITIAGSVMDVSPGTQQQQTYSNYPNGLPCVSDESESLFMESVYQQQVMPSNVTGVLVTISVIDSNNNPRDIGTTTSDASGTFAFTWTPDIPGSYTVTANFLGSNSYYPSSGEAHFYASDAVTPAPTITPQSNLATTTDLMTYIVAGVIAIIIAIAIVGLLLLRKRP